MAALAILVDDASAQQLIARYAALGGDLSKVNRQVSLVMRDKVVETFRTESDPWHQPWPPHAPSTIKARQRKGSTSTKLLVDTARMYDSLDNTSDGTSATVSMAGPAEVHQDGTQSAGRSHNVVIPPRPMFPESNDRGPPEDWWTAVTAPYLTAIEAASA